MFRISRGQGNVLLTGDISAKVEDELVGRAAPLESQVLKVAHHGSKFSSSPEFLVRVSPRVAIVSAEGEGLMNLPNPETLTRLRAAGAKIFRTDIDGAVTVEMKGSGLVVHSYRASAGEGTTGATGAASAAAGTFNVP